MSHPKEASMIELTAGDGHSFSAYRADPADAPKGAVVIIPERPDLTPHIQKIVDAFAAKGYVAIAPSLPDDVSPAAATGDEPPVAPQNEMDKALGAIQTAVDAVKAAGKVAVVGYSRGGDLAYASANRVNGIACVVGYYGGGIVSDYREKRKVPTLLHFGEDDALIPIEDVTQFRAHRPDVSAFTYPGAAHGFDCEGDSFREDAAEKARERTMFWVSQYVEGQPPILLKNAGAYAQAKTERKKKKKGGDDLGPPTD
jgi:carboxymethylenebutenolidase